jgi:hypothetical protein
MNHVNPEHIVTLAPSDMTFLWQECRRCYWLKLKGVLKRPSGPFPKVFTRLDGAMKNYFLDKGSQDLSPRLRPGQVVTGGLTVRSAPLQIPGHETAVIIGGRIDTAIAFDDGTYAIIDYKTSEPKPEHAQFYARQLHAYMVAAENPAPSALELSPITQLGLVIVEPEVMVGLDDGVAFKGKTHFLEIERDDAGFTGFLMQVLLLLEHPEPPAPAPDCSYCRYVAAGSLVLATEYYGT